MGALRGDDSGAFQQHAGNLGAVGDGATLIVEWTAGGATGRAGGRKTYRRVPRSERQPGGKRGKTEKRGKRMGGKEKKRARTNVEEKMLYEVVRARRNREKKQSRRTKKGGNGQKEPHNQRSA